MRPARPLGLLPLDVLKTQNQNISSKSQGSNEGKKRRRSAAATAPPTRARRLTIDPLRWGSVHLSGLFLDGERALVSPALAAGGEVSGGTGESTEVDADDEVEKILDISQSPADDNNDSDAHSDAPPRAEPSAPPCSSSTPTPDDTTSADLAAEKATALRVLYSMFDEMNEDWGGTESVDSDMEREAGAATRADAVPHPFQSSSSHDAADFEVVPAAQKVSKKSTETDTVTAAPRYPDPVQPPAATKLKDLFAPREEEGE
jgi:hypothetical protein